MSALDVWRAAGSYYKAHYEPDLPSCCQRAARSAEARFECPSCTATWERAEQPTTLVLEGEARLQQAEVHYDDGYHLPYELVIDDTEIGNWIENNVLWRGNCGDYPRTSHGTKLPRLRVTVELLEDEE